MHGGRAVDLRHGEAGHDHGQAAPLEPQQGCRQEEAVAEEHPALVQVRVAGDGGEHAERHAQDGAHQDGGEHDPEGGPAERVRGRGPRQVQRGAGHRRVDGDREDHPEGAVQAGPPTHGGEHLRGTEEHEQAAEDRVHDQRDQAVAVRLDPGGQGVRCIAGRDHPPEDPFAESRGAGARVRPQLGHRDGRVSHAHGRDGDDGCPAPGGARRTTHGGSLLVVATRPSIVSFGLSRR